MALGLLLQLRTDRPVAHVIGDNLAVIWFCAGTARLRKVEMQAHLELALGRVLEAGWGLRWQAVRRRLNHSADELATRGVHCAARRRDSGLSDVGPNVEWIACRQRTRPGVVPVGDSP